MQTSATAAVIQALTDPALLIDSNTTVVTANSAARELLGREIENRSLALAIRHPEVLDAVSDVIGGGTPQQIRISLRTSVRRSYIVQIAPLIVPESGVNGALLTLHDMTAQENAEQMRADFVANVSHELRSPLSSLIGFIETLRGVARDDEPARDRFLDIMDGESKRMARLIDDLLSLSKVEANEHVRPEGHVNLQELLADVRNTLSSRALDRTIDVTIRPNASSMHVFGDRDELTEVFHNLIDNAIKYSAKGSTVEIDIGNTDRIPRSGGTGVVVSVADSGDGIEAEHLPRLTERFYRVDKGRSRSMGGTGLGLAIVKHIVNRHRGHLSIESTPGQGSVFKVYLPKDAQKIDPDALS